MKAVMIGGSGAVGSLLIANLAESAKITQITLLNRRHLTLPSSSKIVEHVVDVFDVNSYEKYLAGHDIAFSTLGVGEPSKVSKEEFFRVDVTCALNFARACKKAGIRKFSALTAVGANAESSIYYLRGKGQLENALADLNFDSISLFEPSTIITPTNRYGFSQGILLKIHPLLDCLLVGPMTKFRSIPIADLARAMALDGVQNSTEKVQRLQWSEMQKILQNYS